MLIDVSFQDWVEVLEFDVANKCDYKDLVKDTETRLKPYAKLESGHRVPLSFTKLFNFLSLNLLSLLRP